MAIDREGRKKAANLLQRYMAGKINNRELLEQWPRESEDLQALFWECAWPIVDDLSTHFHSGKHKLNTVGKRAIARTILFLGTEQDYRWPKPAHWQIKAELGALTLSAVLFILWDREWALIIYCCWMLARYALYPLLTKVLTNRYARHGDIEVWPFHSQEDLARASAEPRLLGGKRA